MILLTRDLGLVWLPHIPSWTSSRIYLASSSLTHFRLGIKNPLLYKASFRIVNPAALFLIFQASSTSIGSHSYLRKDRIGAVQPFWLWTLRVWNYSMLGYFWTSTFRFGGMDHSFDNACLAISSASEFWFLGIYVNSTRSNSWAKCSDSLSYFCILSSFTLHSPFIFPITNLELLWRSRFLAPNAFPTLSPVSMASYSASLLVAGNWSCIPYLSTFPSGVMKMTPTPFFFGLMTHQFVSSIFLSCLGPFLCHELWTWWRSLPMPAPSSLFWGGIQCQTG